ncbi:kinase/pyrophosphorylase [Micrococcales bacterium 31B]|nr:kinase/pyrophosphorylase [Micrococcales bacterium 31B]
MASDHRSDTLERATGASETRPCHVFYVSDSTGLTAEVLGNSTLAQFPGVEFHRHTMPFVHDAEGARAVVARVRREAEAGAICFVYTTCVNPAVRELLAEAPCTYIDLLGPTVNLMEQALGTTSSQVVGHAHNQGDAERYRNRIAAIEYSMEHDDGASIRHLNKAQVILLAPSRCGKTPLTMFLAMQHQLYAANFPLTEDDFDRGQLPPPLKGLTNRCFGLTINPQRLSTIRSERMSDSRYASLQQCAYEVRMAEALYARHKIPKIDSSDKSVEEIAALIMQHYTKEN